MYIVDFSQACDRARISIFAGDKIDTADTCQAAAVISTIYVYITIVIKSIIAKINFVISKCIAARTDGNTVYGLINTSHIP